MRHQTRAEKMEQRARKMIYYAEYTQLKINSLE